MDEAAYQAILTRLGLGPAVTATPASPDWLAEWRTLAAMTNGIVSEDPRFPLIMAALDRCDTAYLAGDWPKFRKASQAVSEAVRREIKGQ